MKYKEFMELNKVCTPLHFGYESVRELKKELNDDNILVLDYKQMEAFEDYFCFRDENKNKEFTEGEFLSIANVASEFYPVLHDLQLSNINEVLESLERVRKSEDEGNVFVYVLDKGEEYEILFTKDCKAFSLFRGYGYQLSGNMDGDGDCGSSYGMQHCGCLSDLTEDMCRRIVTLYVLETVRAIINIHGYSLSDNDFELLDDFVERQVKVFGRFETPTDEVDLYEPLNVKKKSYELNICDDELHIKQNNIDYVLEKDLFRNINFGTNKRYKPYASVILALLDYYAMDKGLPRLKIDSDKIREDLKCFVLEL